MNGTINQGIKHKLRIALIISHLPLIRQSVAFLRQVQSDGVYTRAVVVERIEVAGAVDTRLRRCSHIEHQLLKVDIESR